MMEIITDRREFVALCERFGLDYEKKKVLNLAGKKVWACYVTSRTPHETRFQMEAAGYKLIYVSGCYYHYIKRLQNENNNEGIISV